jgi:NAD(P)-dependent dehydrogenase (short-subunit alcohol dehydrogenase family)
MLGDLTDKVALVTGGARGLGRGIVLVMAECGADMAVADLHLAGAQQVAGEASGHGHRAQAFQVDVTDTASVRKMVQDVLAAFGRIDILVNCAGVIGAPGYEEAPISREEDWDITYQVNVKGTVIVSDAVAEHMKQRRYGKIINIASHAGRHGTAGAGGAYGASKAAVIHLAQSYALDLAPYDINVNSICPGTIWTPMWDRIARRRIHNDPSKAHLTPRQIFDQVIKEICPLGREQTPEDMGKMAAFLASDDAKNITGQAINVNGGSRLN